MIRLALSNVIERLGSTTRRGIRPATMRESSLRSRIMPTPMPEELVLSLQHYPMEAGSPSNQLQPCVDEGEWVAKYQLLAKSTGTHPMRLHAPTSGTVVAIEDLPPPTGSQRSQRAIRLRTDAEERALPLQAVADYRALAPDRLVQLIEDAGICGMGGAGFPAATKIRHAVDKGAKTLIINGVECEPYISCDEALIRERANLAVQGAELLQAACLADECIIVIDNTMTTARNALADELKGSSIELKVVPRRYPAGDERQLVKAITRREVPSNRHPIDIGILVQNIATAVACYEAIALARPCISRIVTLTGNALLTPKNFDAPIGTPVQHLLNLCGVNEEQHEFTIRGGPMMGQYLLDNATPIDKTTNCIIATSAEEFPEQEREQACIRCSYCEQSCPAHLQPQRLLASIRSEEWQETATLGLSDCIECGACAVVCPSRIPLVSYYRAAKEFLGEERRTQQHSQHWQERFQYHQYRNKKNQEKQRPTTTAKTATSVEPVFSRDKARMEISAAVERVRRRRQSRSKTDTTTQDES